MTRKIVVIGGVACGPKSAARARRMDPDADITIIERGEILSYAGCGLPYFISGDVPDINELMATPLGVVRDTVFFKNVKDIHVLNHTLAETIDREDKKVHMVNVQTGEKGVIPYDSLVLATGGMPVTPPIEGVDLNRVFRLTYVEDAQAIETALKKGTMKRAVIIGGGLIGVEVTEALVKRGLSVTIVEMMDRLLPGLFDDEMSAFLTSHLKQKGVTVMTETKVSRIIGDPQGGVAAVETDGGTIDADMVLVAVGVRPNVKLGADAGLEVGSRGGLVVNERMQTSDPDIYAGGDCVEQKRLVGEQQVFVPMGSTANKHGRVIGTNITGGNDTFRGVLGTAIVKVFDFNAGTTGLSEAAAKDAGFDVMTTLSPAPDKAHFYPNALPIAIKLVADKKTRKLLGAQIIGPGVVDKRLDVVITAMTFGATVDDLANLDLAYAPPYSPAMDNIITAANVLRNKIDGLARGYSPRELKEKLDKKEDFVILDARMPTEIEEIGRIDAGNIINIPLGAIRKRIDEIPRDKEIVTMCKISLRGYEALKILEGLGYSNLAFLDGGILLWPYEKTTALP